MDLNPAFSSWKLPKIGETSGVKHMQLAIGGDYPPIL